MYVDKGMVINMEYIRSNGEIGFAPDEQTLYAKLEGQYKVAKYNMDQVLNQMKTEGRDATPAEEAKVNECMQSLNDVIITLDNNHIPFSYDEAGYILITNRIR